MTKTATKRIPDRTDILRTIIINSCGLTTIEYAVTNSLNTVAYKVLDMLTLDKSFDFVKNKLIWTAFLTIMRRQAEQFFPIRTIPRLLSEE